jgi:hypothetical protein
MFSTQRALHEAVGSEVDDLQLYDDGRRSSTTDSEPPVTNSATTAGGFLAASELNGSDWVQHDTLSVQRCGRPTWQYQVTVVASFGLKAGLPFPRLFVPHCPNLDHLVHAFKPLEVVK